MRFPSILRRRPSAALVISSVALFVSLGGASYAAVTIPNNSVGSAQLRRAAVTNSKIAQNAVSFKQIQAGAVGTVRANLNQLQARVGQTCATGTAIGTISNNGKVSCNTTLPAEYGTTTNSVNLSGSNSVLNSTSLPGGSSYVAFASPNVQVTGTGTAQRVLVSCTLTVGSNTQTQSVTINTGTVTGNSHAAIPLQVAGPAGAAQVACVASLVNPGTGAAANLPATVATGSLNALQTSANN